MSVYQNHASATLGAGIGQKVQTVTEQLRGSRDELQKLIIRMEDLIARTGIHVVNEIKPTDQPPVCPQSGDTRSVTIDIQEMCNRLHHQMDVLDNIA